MAHTNRSMIAAVLASAIAWTSHVAVMVFETAADALYWPVAFIIDTFKWVFAPDPRDPLTYALHPTKADDVRWAAPFKAFLERARKRWTWGGDHFRAPVIVGT